MRKVLSFLRRAIVDFDMIQAGDKIAVGVSGGKDSMLLLGALNDFRKFFDIKFDLIAITLDMGFNKSDFSELIEYCAKNEIEFHLIKTDIGNVVFNIRNEKSPCSLCSKMRRGALNDTAKSLGCNKVALGHNFDDVVETVFMNLFYEGRYGCFAPVTYLSRVDITVIRPLIYMTERDIINEVRRDNIPITKSCCPANGVTKRQYMKNLFLELEKENKDLREKIFSSLKKSGVNGWR